VDERESTSIWKKEISLRRKPKQKRVSDAPAPAKPDETSVWKKEISLRRKPKPVSDAPAPAKPKETSIWKKEISLRQKPKQKRVSDTPAPAKPKETSIWKKEISFRRRPKDSGYTLIPPPQQPVESKPEPGVESPPLIPGPSFDPDVLPILPPVAPPPVTPVAPPPVTPVAPSVMSPLPPAPPEPGALEPGVDEAPTEVAAPVLDPEVRVKAPPERPQPEAAEPPTPSRRERRESRRAAARLSKEQRKHAKELEKADRKANRHSRVVGLKIGASQIAAAEVVNKGGPRLVRMARVPLARGVVVGGELREPEELAAVLKTFFRRNKLPRSCVRLGISNDRIGVRTFEITGIDDPKQLANAVRFRAQETLPIPLEEAVLDYRVLEDTVGEDGIRVRRVLLVVAHRELVDRYVAACRKAGLKLIGIDLEAFGLLRAVSDPADPPAEDAAVVCVSIGHDRSTLAVSDGRVCQFTRVLAWGGSALDVALARVLDLTPSAVEPIKHGLSLVGEGEGGGLDARHADEARRAMAAELQGFARELVASLRFYQEQPNSLGIVEILVTGGTAACGGLATELERLTGLPVRVADPLARVRAQRKLRKVENGSLAVAVGLGIED
jgi:type IV pilus assembly protein PilM